MTASSPFRPLDSLDIAVTAEDLARLFAPFARTVSPDDGEWKRELRRRRRRIAVRLLRRYLGGRGGTGRAAAAVRDEYSKAWRKIDYGIYDPAARGLKQTPWHHGAAHHFASDVGATRCRQLLLIRVIERLRPRRVLEVGCGNGINLLLLAGRFPDIAFTGLELTAAGVTAARALQGSAPQLPQALQRFAPEPLADPAAFRRIAFVQGDAVAMPFPDGRFDLVYSVLALEQMEAVRAAALAEIGRVCGHAYFGVEPFREANATLWRRLYVRQRGYFTGSLGELAAAGLEPQWATMDFPQEMFLGACAVLAERRALEAPRADAA